MSIARTSKVSGPQKRKDAILELSCMFGMRCDLLKQTNGKHLLQKSLLRIIFLQYVMAFDTQSTICSRGITICECLLYMKTLVDSGIMFLKLSVIPDSMSFIITWDDIFGFPKSSPAVKQCNTVFKKKYFFCSCSFFASRYWHFIVLL